MPEPLPTPRITPLSPDTATPRQQEVIDDQMITDPTWAELSDRYDEQELIQTVMILGYYHLVAIVLHTLGVQIEDGQPAFLDD